MCSQVILGRSDGTKPLEVLEREITSLATQIHAATCRWLGLVGEYDAREGWAHVGRQDVCAVGGPAVRDRAGCRRASTCAWRGGCASCR